MTVLFRPLVVRGRSILSGLTLHAYEDVTFNTMFNELSFARKKILKEDNF